MRIKLIGLALVASLAAVPATASALQWLLNGKPITTAVAVKQDSKLLLGDRAATGGAVAFVCTATEVGTVGPGAHDELTEMSNVRCEFQKNGSCTAEDQLTLAPLHLPWKSLLVTLAGGRNGDQIAGTGGNPGWAVECTVGGIIKIVDECTSATFEPEVDNLSNGVDVTFLESETLSCTEGNSTSGMLIGTIFTLNPAGGTLSVSNSPNR